MTANAGTYTVVVSNSAGTVTSNAATLTVDVPGRLVNLSVLTPLAAGETMTIGLLPNDSVTVALSRFPL